jgi:hypothetical protein
MANRTGHVSLAVLAGLPVSYLPRGNILVTGNARALAAIDRPVKHTVAKSHTKRAGHFLFITHFLIIFSWSIIYRYPFFVPR